MPKPASRTTRPAVRKPRKPVRKTPAPCRVKPDASYDNWLAQALQDPAEAAAYLQPAIDDGDQAGLMLALRRVAQARGGVARIAGAAKLTREATYRMLSRSGNPELRRFTAILHAAGLKLSVEPVAGRRRARAAA